MSAETPGIDVSRPAAVIGAGSWGTALAVHLARQGPVRLWCRRPELASRLAAERRNETYLPGVLLPETVEPTFDAAHAVDGAACVVLAVPTQSLREVLRAVPEGALPGDAYLVIACKGIEIGTLAFPGRIVSETLGDEATARTVMLSGPSFAMELAAGQPTAVVSASETMHAATAVQARFSGGSLRVYSSTDLLGVQLAAALKNVVAIGAGVADGLGFGHNAQAALITRSLAEMARLGVTMGARHETFLGLAGVGDLVLTCTGGLSRNRRVGTELGRGRTLGEVLASMSMVAEGVPTASAARRIAEREGVEMPIVEQVHALLHEGKSPGEALADLLARPLRPEAEKGRP